MGRFLRRLRAARLAAALAASLALAAIAAPAVLGQSPAPYQPGGDTRSSGQGPGLVGSPVLVAAGVVVIGVGAAAATVLYVRLTRDR